MPSKKIVALLIVVIAILVSTMILKKDTIQIVKDGFIKIIGGGGESVEDDVDKNLESNINKTEYLFNQILPNAVLVAGSKTTNGAFTASEDMRAHVAKIAETLEYEVKKYTIKDIKVVSDSDENIAKYFENLFDSSIEHANNMTENELDLVALAIQTNDTSFLAPIPGIINEYKNFTQKLLDISVPQVFSQKHVDAVNNYNIITISVRDMQKVFSDPISALVAIENYRTATAKNDIIFNEIGLYLNNIIKKYE